jgi:transposase-like protein
MKKILQIDRKSKVRKAKAVEVMKLKEYGALEVDSRVALIQELIPIGLMHIADELKREVEELAGERYKRGGIAGYDRWGEQEGSVYILDQKIPIKVSRVRDTINNREVSLSTYKKLQQPAGKVEDKLLKKVLYGLSCRDYRECSEAIPEALSLSPSTVSRRYIRASNKKLKELTDRRLDQYDFVSVVMDGKAFGDDGMIIALGGTVEGRKVVLGIIQSSTENHKVCKDFLLKLIDRGLKYDKGLLVVADGAKGIRKAINEVFGIYGIVQRCQWHKRENIVAYLPKHLIEEFRKKLQDAYSKEDYKKAKAAFQAIKSELRLINESAVNSLEEGFEETLTIQRLGIHRELMKSFKTTNMIESVMALVGQRTDKVDYWKNSNQKQRWVATSLLSIEQRLNRVKGYRHLIELRNALQREIQNRGGMDERKEAVAA